MKERRSGILLHPSSLPSKYGIGEFGSDAYKFIDFLKQSKQSLWQILPLGPTGYGDSPYQSFSSFAGNQFLISIENLIEKNYLKEEDAKILKEHENDEFVNYGFITYHKKRILNIAYKKFLENPAKDFQEFCDRESFWLDDYALFMSVKEEFEARVKGKNIEIIIWNKIWDEGIKLRRDKDLKEYQEKLKEEILLKKAEQYLFYTQWFKLKKYANDIGIKIIGDIPIFVALDSSDVWANRENYLLDKDAKPTVVAGVPPDYFSETGQLWGNPLYNWEKMKEDNFSWWISRIKHSMKLYDFTRIDHFRGFEAYWEVPANEKTAINGRWVKAPGVELFRQIKKEFANEINIIAEDLGVITPEVEALRDDFNLPGMKVMQFAFDSGEGTGEDRDNNFLPHNYEKNCIAYSGTHDNDTTKGWLKESTKADKGFAWDYLGKIDKNDEVLCFIRALFVSHANMVVFPMQDLLNQDSKYRMNTPSTLGNNWHYRTKKEDFSKELKTLLRKYSINYSRNKNDKLIACSKFFKSFWKKIFKPIFFFNSI